MLPRVLPFVILLIGVMVALYGGYATPSETAGLGAVLALVLIAVVYSVWRPKDAMIIYRSTLKESTMLMFIIGMSLLYSYVMSYLHISQSAAEWIVAMQSVQVGAARGDFAVCRGAWFLSAAGLDYPDDGAHYFAAAEGLPDSIWSGSAWS